MDYQSQTSSGIPLQPVYGPKDRQCDPAAGRVPVHPGQLPRRLPRPDVDIRQYSGFGTAEESNERYRYLLDQGGTGCR